MTTSHEDNFPTSLPFPGGTVHLVPRARYMARTPELEQANRDYLAKIEQALKGRPFPRGHVYREVQFTMVVMRGPYGFDEVTKEVRAEVAELEHGHDVVLLDSPDLYDDERIGAWEQAVTAFDELPPLPREEIV